MKTKELIGKGVMLLAYTAFAIWMFVSCLTV